MPENLRCPQCGGSRLVTQQADSGPGWRVHIEMRRWLAEAAVAVLLTALLVVVVQSPDLLSASGWQQAAGYWLIVLPTAGLLIHLIVGAPFVRRRHPAIAQRLTCQDCGYHWLQRAMDAGPAAAAGAPR